MGLKILFMNYFTRRKEGLRKHSRKYEWIAFTLISSHKKREVLKIKLKDIFFVTGEQMYFLRADNKLDPKRKTRTEQSN